MSKCLLVTCFPKNSLVLISVNIIPSFHFPNTTWAIVTQLLPCELSVVGGTCDFVSTQVSQCEDVGLLPVLEKAVDEQQENYSDISNGPGKSRNQILAAQFECYLKIIHDPPRTKEGEKTVSMSIKSCPAAKISLLNGTLFCFWQMAGKCLSNHVHFAPLIHSLCK